MIERKITRAAAQAMMSELNTVLEIGAGEATIHLFDTELVLEVESPEVLGVRLKDGTFAGRFYVASVNAAPGYPPDVPFIAGETVMVSDPSPTSVSLIWWTPLDPDAVFGKLCRESESAGWVREPGPDLIEPKARLSTYRKGSATRHLVKSEGTVSVHQLMGT